MDSYATPVIPKYARKKLKQPDKWKRNIAKKLRYTPKSLPTYPTCNHNSNKFKCSLLNMQDLQKFHKLFYDSKSKPTQDAFLLKYCSPIAVKRRRPKNNTNIRKSFQTKYRVRITSTKSIPVCQNTFLNILGIKKYRVQTVMRSYFLTGTLCKENRGGDRMSNKFTDKVDSVMSFIQMLKCTEPHYCRGSSTGRMYLPSDLSINKLCKMYNNQISSDLEVKPSYFRHLFNSKFNLGFGTPRTDVCSTCLEYLEKIRTENNQQIKKNLMTGKRVHTLKSKAFFEILREKKSNIKTFSYDCQKNLPLPKLPDQSTYYSRQLYLYNFTIVEGSSGERLTKDNVFSYCWTEDYHAKGSNEIASAVYDRLIKTNFTNISIVRLVADGCGGQNKNSTMLTMCSKWLLDAPRHIKSVQLIFPVTGHSYIPPDRVFGNIEKELRKQEVLVEPNVYYQIISNYATVVKLGSECMVMNWKDAGQKVLKPPGKWPFKFSLCKRFILRRSTRAGNVLIQGEYHYKSNLGNFCNVNKMNCKTTNIQPNIIVGGSMHVKREKLRDVNKLLSKHYGAEWRAIPILNYFNNTVPENFETVTDTDYIEEEEVMCQEHEAENEPIV